METVSRQTSTTKPCIALVLIAPRPRPIIRIKIIRIWTEISDLDRYLPHHTLLRDLDTTHWPQRRFAQRSRFRPRGERGVLLSWDMRRPLSRSWSQDQYPCRGRSS